MEVILLQKLGRLGDVGDLVNVRAGYARNYLFPKSQAILATKKNIAEFEARKAELLKAAAEKLAGEEKRAALLEGLIVTVEANVGEEGKLFGSVGTRHIAEAVSAAGHPIEKSEVSLPEGAFRQVGEYPVTIVLSGEVSAAITVIVAPAAEKEK